MIVRVLPAVPVPVTLFARLTVTARVPVSTRLTLVARLTLTARLAFSALLALTTLTMLACDRGPRRVEIVTIVAVPARAGDGFSNVRARDYVGPDVCGDCHEDKHARWQASLHASMNRRADDPGAVIGDFEGAQLAYGGGRATFTRDRGAYIMTLEPPRDRVRRYRVTRTIGSRYLQEYVGVELAPAASAASPVEIRLPFGWWPRAGGWMPRAYFDSWYGDERDADGALAVDPYAPDREPWATRCAWCHNTYPFEIRVARAAARDVGHGPEQWFAPAAPGDLTDLARAAIAHDNLLPIPSLVTVGVSCESCHLGGRDHAARPREVAPSFVPSSPSITARAGAPDLRGGRHNPVVVDAICAQCHSTPSPRYPNGAAVRNSTEALDLQAGACAPSIKCTDCHDPHTAGPGPGAPDPARSLAACTHCHARYADADAARAHSGHDTAHVSCLDCHMPRIVAGVSAFVRTHRISSPSDPVMLAGGAPNACNLCHLDRSIAWTLRALAQRGTRAAIDDAAVRAGAGDPDAPLGPVWLASASAQVRITAAAAYARAPRDVGRAALPALVPLLADPVAYDRMFSLFAIEDILGRRLSPTELDRLADQPTRAAQANALRARVAAGAR